MEYLSTRSATFRTGLADAIRLGLAPDGGLLIPARWPRIDPATVTGGDWLTSRGLADLGERLLGPFAEGDRLGPALGSICRGAFAFPAPWVGLGDDDRYGVLELFHGPTAAFKDYGARFLAESLGRLRVDGDPPVNILVATSGDTGGAVAAAFHRRPGFRVTLLYPKGLVSPTQERQLTCWGDNVTSCAVRGTFDACQRMVKEAFVDPGLRKAFALSSANSINIGRLLPQAIYYAAASLEAFRQFNEPLSFIIPSGNLGNAFGCLIAREIGMPVGEIVLAHNANGTVVDYLATGEWRPRPSVPTIASAMDVGDPSNMERFRARFADLRALRAAVSAETVDDAAIRARITADAARYGRVWCPHTATAAEVYARWSPERKARGRWAIVATAHPAKFPEIVEPLIGGRVDVPASLRNLLARPTAKTEIAATLEALMGILAS
ncbi:MAG: threonine synthase [Gemmatimonadales bacterium]